MKNQLEDLITNLFLLLYYYAPNTWNQGHTKWMGVPCFQNPLDLWIMQEIIFETKPTLLIETGSATGGTALFFAHLFDQLLQGRVLSIDTQEGMTPMCQHSRIVFFKGNSTDAETLIRVKEEIGKEERVMVLLDSDHTPENVLAELRAYNQFVSPGCYLLIHDTHLGGHPIKTDPLHGNPMEAVERFLEENKEFVVDRGKEKFYMTFLPGGWLRRKEIKKEV